MRKALAWLARRDEIDALVVLALLSLAVSAMTLFVALRVLALAGGTP